jgi:hypothetical protein
MVVGWDDFGSIVLLEMKGLEEVNKYSWFSPSSLLVVKLISVERREDGFSLPLLTACSFFRLQLPFNCINFFEKEKEDQRLLSGSSFGFKASLFLLFKFGNCSAISRVMVVLVTIVTPNVGPLMMFRRLAYTTGNIFIAYYYLLVMRKDWDRWCAWSSPSSLNAWNKTQILHKTFQKYQCLHSPLIHAIQDP